MHLDNLYIVAGQLKLGISVCVINYLLLLDNIEFQYLTHGSVLLRSVLYANDNNGNIPLH